jgi:hypothetical protein
MDATEDIMEDTRWRKAGWIAQVVKNLDDDGWAVEMTRVGDQEPALVGPWTMGRDKKNPKPLDAGAFATLVKTASEVLRRHEQALHERMHKTLTFTTAGGDPMRAQLDVCADDDDPHAILAIYSNALDDAGNPPLRSGRVSPAFKLNVTSAERFLRTGA